MSQRYRLCYACDSRPAFVAWVGLLGQFSGCAVPVVDPRGVPSLSPRGFPVSGFVGGVC